MLSVYFIIFIAATVYHIMAAWQEALINAVSTRRCLFDKKHDDYRDTRTVKENNWKDVAAEMKEATGLEFSG